jgi:hypothetical protein
MAKIMRRGVEIDTKNIKAHNKIWAIKQEEDERVHALNPRISINENNYFIK